MEEEIREHLINGIIPFWKQLADKENGGFVGYVDYDLKKDIRADKGCILNSRITWFFSNAYMLLHDDDLLSYAKVGFDFMMKHCIDEVYGGIYWSVTYDGKCADTMKHTYNQAFAIYALASYYDATKDMKALNAAYDLYRIIETKCRDKDGYLEAFDRSFHAISNDALSENGVMASRTMNTLLHVMEAYTELYRVTQDAFIKRDLCAIMDTFLSKVYNFDKGRQEVFFDREWKSLIDLYSYGHDIETSWLLDRTVSIVGDEHYKDLIYPITAKMAENVYAEAFDGRSLANESENGVVNRHRIWWVQAEALLGFMNAYRKNPQQRKFLAAARAEWCFIRDYMVDDRYGSEWFWEVNSDGKPYPDRPIVEPWKCPYHNGRMCMEVLKSACM